MSGALYACAYAAEFPAQALLRLQPDLAAEPVAVLEGQAPEESVCALNGQARRRGAALGMTRLEAESLGGLKLLARSPESEVAARAVFLECAAQFSPRVEKMNEGEASERRACACVLDIAGTERLFGPPEQLAGRLRAALAGAGFRASIAVSANYDAARMKAAAGRGIAVIAEGAEASALEKLPIAVLGLIEEHAETFALWGIGTLGELARLPEAALVTRCGAEARRWHALARGAAEHAFQPIEPEFSLEEFCAFETPVEQIDSLLFVGARMIDCLAARASSRALALASIDVEMKLEGGETYRRTIRPALPTSNRKFLLKLLQLEIGAHPPRAAVMALRLTAEAGPSSKVQLGLFTPQMPEPSRLDVTLARLKALVGEDRVGAPALQDTHQAGSFRMEEFSLAGGKAAPAGAPSFAQFDRAKGGKPQNSTTSPTQVRPRMALRRVRPPMPVRVVLHALKPAAFRDAENRFEVVAAYGPWRSSGCWWSDGEWDTEEWDVLATKADGAPAACLLLYDRKQGAWRLEAFYD
jgi:protein ImuB